MSYLPSLSDGDILTKDRIVFANTLPWDWNSDGRTILRVLVVCYYNLSINKERMLSKESMQDWNPKNKIII